MNETDQRIAIAEACGWRLVKLHNKFPNSVIGTMDNLGRHGRGALVPDYLNDLNACHEMEKVLTEEQRWKFGSHLSNLIFKGEMSTNDDFAPNELGCFELSHATAAQRAEAFLRTLNLWKEDL